MAAVVGLVAPARSVDMVHLKSLEGAGSPLVRIVVLRGGTRGSVQADRAGTALGAGCAGSLSSRASRLSSAGSIYRYCYVSAVANMLHWATPSRGAYLYSACPQCERDCPRRHTGSGRHQTLPQTLLRWAPLPTSCGARCLFVSMLVQLFQPAPIARPDPPKCRRHVFAANCCSAVRVFWTERSDGRGLQVHGSTGDQGSAARWYPWCVAPERGASCRGAGTWRRVERTTRWLCGQQLCYRRGTSTPRYLHTSARGPPPTLAQALWRDTVWTALPW
jgi:hypothetical protein